MRQLAAIMFADMSGYTALMQENEQLAKSKRRRLKAVLEIYLPQFNGNLLQYYGDGSLSIFNSAIDSVQCAIQIQQMLRQEPTVDLRIGIHTGDIIMEDETIYGDGVNLASRIESLAVAGGIFVSEKVYDEIKNQNDISTREMGYFEIKNVKVPVRIFAISNDGITVPSRVEIKGKTKQPANRLAVLPFVNMSADLENEYFSDGITEELLNALTKVEGLQVTSRTSAFAFKGKNDDIRDIALKLNVDKVLEGSVRKAGNRVRITVQLINAADGYHIWSENYDRNLTDIFEVQDEISSIIANRLRENLTQAQFGESLVKAPVKNVDAYNLFLRGLHFYNKITPSDTRKAIQCFEEAVALEPAYAQAYALMAASFAYLGATGQKETHKAFEIVHRYSDKALELDPSLPEGHIAKGAAYLFYNWQWDKGYEALQKAIELNPAATEAYRLLGFYFIIIGQKQEAIKVMQKALLLDPLSPIIGHYLANAYLINRDYDAALVQAQKVLEMHPQMRITFELTGWCTGLKGDWQKALTIFEEVHRLTNHPLKGLTPMGYAYGKLGERDKALECIAKMEQRQAEDPDAVVDSDLAMVWWSLGEAEKVFDYLNHSILKGLGPVAIIIQLPQLTSLRDDPRYDLMVEKLGLTSHLFRLLD